jgi:methylglutaconyl-CoA hydratase
MEEVLYRVEDGAAWITMNRPTKGNSISGSMGDLIVKYLAEAEADPNVSAIVLAAAGTYWCTGADLGASNQSKVGEKLKAGTAGNDISQVFQQIKKSPKPVIARVQGPVMGGGLGFLFACDIRVSINSAFFAFSEAKR